MLSTVKIIWWLLSSKTTAILFTRDYRQALFSIYTSAIEMCFGVGQNTNGHGRHVHVYAVLYVQNNEGNDTVSRFDPFSCIPWIINHVPIRPTSTVHVQKVLQISDRPIKYRRTHWFSLYNLITDMFTAQYVRLWGLDVLNGNWSGMYTHTRSIQRRLIS